MESVPVIYLVNLEVLEKEGPLVTIPFTPLYSTIESAKKALEEQAKWSTDSLLRFAVRAQSLDQSLRFIERDKRPPPVLAGYLSERKVHYWEEPKKVSQFDFYLNKQASPSNTQYDGGCFSSTASITEEEMWQEHIKGGMFVCSICSVCKGSSSGTCACARRAFMSTLTVAQIQEFRDRNKKPATTTSYPQFSFGGNATTADYVPGFNFVANSNTWPTFNNTQPQTRYNCGFIGCQGCIECRPSSMN